METTRKPIEPLLNEHDVSEILGVSLATLRRWRLLGAGPKVRKIGALCKYTKSDLEQWLASRPTGGGK
jgi:predicted DNA-binding transcriptional regulator AlpA